MKKLDSVSSKRIVTVATEIFALHGYHGSSIREITQKAGVNLAAIHYHVGDKKSLYMAVLVSFLRPINQSRLVKLAEAVKHYEPRPVPLPLVIELFARPFFDLTQSKTEGGSAKSRLFGRSMVEPLPFADNLLAKELHPVIAQFSKAIRRHAPDVAPQRFMWRLNFIVGAMHHTLAIMHRMKNLTDGLCEDDNPGTAFRYFSEFAVANLATLSSAGTDGAMRADFPT